MTPESSACFLAKTVLLVDNEDEERISMKWLFSHFGYTVDCARSGEEALLIFDPTLHDLIITDNPMPGMNGSEMAHIIKLRSPETPIIMYTSSPPADRACLDAVIEKPAHFLLLKDAVGKLLAENAS